MARTPEGSGINILALVKEDERYVFLYDDTPESRMATLQTFGRYAGDKELGFSWYDAAVLSQKMRRLFSNQRDVDAEDDDPST